MGRGENSPIDSVLNFHYLGQPAYNSLCYTTACGMEIASSVSARLVSCLTLLFLCNPLRSCLAADTIVPGQSISGEQTLVSAGEKFVLGFFSPGNSRNRYLGIWFKADEPLSVIWVANREKPITDTFPGVLKFSNDGNLTVLDGNQNSSTLWSTTSSVSAKRAKLLDTGNLVLIDGDETSERFLWQSFDYPTDTYVPGIKIGRNLKTGHIWSLTSWKSSNDPSPGNFTFEMDLRGLPQLVISKGHGLYYSSGPWNGHIWSGVPIMGRDYIGNYSFIRNDDEVYLINNPNNSTIPFKLVMDKSGMLQHSTWSIANWVWTLYWSAPKGPCQFYDACGAFGVCSVDSLQRCTCLQGFKPKSQKNWDLSDWSGGCVRKTELKCGDEDGFFRLIGMKLPDVTTLDQIDENLSLQECKAKCLNDCSCRAFANFGVRGAGSGCAIWSVDLMDLQEYSVGGEEFYLRVASSELGLVTREGSSTVRRTLAIAIGSSLSGLLLLVIWRGCYMGKQMKKNKIGDGNDEDDKKSWEFPLFKFGVIEAATNNFSQANKVGQGGFGPVYKGKLPNGQEIAVKRLSKYSGQGLVEFENEVILTARLQHRNLVRLLGYCTHKEEKILIYEYMPNRGLDSFLFDQNKSVLLDWKKRFNIIAGIARGILYLHQDSRLRVIHRDLKSGNILLDVDMSPKISDFGMARSFGRNQVQANTRKVVGTYGYMPPEYAIRGIFSEKSDVFSFGVLVLEIVSGKKINGFCHLDESLSLTGYAWKLWQEGRGLELMDPSLGDSCPKWQVLRCIHVGLLCVQESPKDRPNMSSIVSILGSETNLSPPKKPAFSIISDPDSSSLKPCSSNSVTITLIQAR